MRKAIAIRKKFNREYKLESLWLAEECGVAVAGERLGIDKSMQYQFRKKSEAEGSDTFRGNGNPTAVEEEYRLSITLGRI